MRTVLRARAKLLAELASCAGILRGSYLERSTTCSRKGCACHRGKRHGPRAYVVVRDGKRQRQHYVPKGQEQAVRAGIKAYKRLLYVVDRITALNLELLRGGVLTDSEH